MTDEDKLMLEAVNGWNSVILMAKKYKTWADDNIKGWKVRIRNWKIFRMVTLSLSCLSVGITVTNILYGSWPSGLFAGIASVMIFFSCLVTFRGIRICQSGLENVESASARCDVTIATAEQKRHKAVGCMQTFDGLDHAAAIVDSVSTVTGGLKN